MSNLVPQWLITISDPLHEELLVKEVEQIGQFLTIHILQEKQDTPILYLWVLLPEEAPNMDHSSDVVKALSERVKQELLLQPQLSSVTVRILPIRSHQHSLEGWTAALAPDIHKVSVRHPMDSLGQVVSTGDPLTAHAFFMEAMRQWEERYVSIYWNEDSLITEHTTNTLKGRDWLTVFRKFVRGCAYRAALTSLKEYMRLNPHPDRHDSFLLAQHALLMLIDRMNFAFRDASVHLQPLEANLRNQPLVLETRMLLNKLEMKEGTAHGDLARIVELYRHLDIYLDMDDLHSFFIRFYRARESVLEYIYKYGGDTLREVPRALQAVHHLIDIIEENYADGTLYRYIGAYFYSKSKNVTDTLKLRNSSIVGHGRKGFRNKTVWEKYTGYGEHPLQTSKLKFERDTALLLKDLGAEADAHFSQWNDLILQLVSQGVNGYAQEAAASRDE